MSLAKEGIRKAFDKQTQLFHHAFMLMITLLTIIFLYKKKNLHQTNLQPLEITTRISSYVHCCPYAQKSMATLRLKRIMIMSYILANHWSFKAYSDLLSFIKEYFITCLFRLEFILRQRIC